MEIAAELNGSGSVKLDNEYVLLLGQLKRASRRVGGPDIQVKDMSEVGYAKTKLDELSEIIHQDDVAIIVRLRGKLGIADPVEALFQSLDSSEAQESVAKHLKGVRN